MSLDDNFKQQLKDAIHKDPADTSQQATEDTEWKDPFSVSDFYHKWFRESGSSYFFLFKKNLSVTNIQLAELMALLRCHTTNHNGDRMRDLQFLSVGEFKDSVGRIVQDLRPARPHPSDSDLEKRADTIAELYSSIFRRVVIMDTFFGSCAMFVPPGLRVDVPAICAASGYIHSCGSVLFIRNTNKATLKELKTAIETHMSQHDDGKGDTTHRLVVYTHEDFTPNDRELASELKNGLDDVKLYVYKYFMRDISLVDVVQDIAGHFSEKLEVESPVQRPNPSDTHLKEPQKEIRTLWLILERQIGDSSRSKGDQRYYICYEQRYKNDNPFYIFDENKPAWIAHTTIPHSLAAAMVNITRPWWPEQEEVTVADPFCGTGTVGIEACKYNATVSIMSDINPIVRLLVEDNRRFFSLSADELEELAALAGNLLDTLKGTRIVTDSHEYMKRYKNLCKLSDKFISAATNEDNLRVSKRLAKYDFTNRMIFYMAMRTRLRHAGELALGHITYDEAYANELHVLLSQTKRLRESCRSDRSHRQIGFGITYDAAPGEYSTSLTFGPGCFDESILDVQVTDVRDLQEKYKFDVIITDPPYGFNTSEDPADLARLWHLALRNLLRALKDDGQLVMCLPAQSHTGRHLPFFTSRDVIVQQVLTLAEELHLEIVIPAHSVPLPRRLYRFPFYWESERALRREIVHFRIRHRSSTRSEPRGSSGLHSSGMIASAPAFYEPQSDGMMSIKDGDASVDLTGP